MVSTNTTGSDPTPTSAPNDDVRLSARFFVTVTLWLLFCVHLRAKFELQHHAHPTKEICNRIFFFLFFSASFFLFVRPRRLVSLLALLAACNAAKLDGALSNMLAKAQTPEAIANNARLFELFTEQFPFLASNGAIVDHFAQHADQLQGEERAAFEKARAAVDRDAKPTLRSVASSGVAPTTVAVRCTVHNGDGESAIAGMHEIGFKGAKANGGVVSGLIATNKIEALRDNDALKSCRIDVRATHAGRATSQGDRAAHTDVARSLFGLTGKGVTVGVISDSFDCDRGATARDIASGDLPADTVILEELSVCADDDVNNDGGSDEGRAMAQLIHDMAPDASIRFCSAFNGFIQFANCIDGLVAAGCDVIVDDVFYFAEASFQDDLIAQAADRAAAAGVPYFSSAGNSARDSWEGPFVKSSVVVDLGALENSQLEDDNVQDLAPDDDDEDDAFLHDFDLSNDDQLTTELPQFILSETDDVYLILLQWSDPFPSIAAPPTGTSACAPAPFRLLA
jgi:hypothetical protein